MRTKYLKGLALAAALGALPLAAAAPAPLYEGAEPAGWAAEDPAYQRGTAALDAQKWSEAIAAFSSVVAKKDSNADRAMYWLAYAQHKDGRATDALETVQELLRLYPKSRWKDDAKALAVEIRQSSGRPVSPDALGDDELKLIAITSLLHTDQERAVTILEKILKAEGSRETKERALFVLAQSSSPRARQVLEAIARGGSGREMQLQAIQTLGIHSRSGSRELIANIYRESTDARVREAVLHALMVSGDRERLMQVATGEQNADLREKAVHLLGAMGARNDLWSLYAKEQSLAVKKQIIQALFIAGDVDHLVELTATEKNPELRADAIRGLGLAGGAKAGAALSSLWQSATDNRTKLAVIEALFLRSDAKTLIALARKESDRELKRELVQRISLMHTPEAQQFMLELLQ